MLPTGTCRASQRAGERFAYNKFLRSRRYAFEGKTTYSGPHSPPVPSEAADGFAVVQTRDYDRSRGSTGGEAGSLQ